MEYLSSLDILEDKIIKVDKSDFGNEKGSSKIIRISLLTPNLGEGIDNIEKLNTSDLAWSTLSLKEKYAIDSYQIIFENKTLSPWKLIRKK